MSNYTYTPTLVAQSDDSYIVKREFVVIQCNPTPPVGSCDLFNATRCGNDECYAQPFINGDVLYFQWNFSMPQSMSLDFTITLVDVNFDPIVYDVPLTSFGVGFDSDLKPYQWILIDTQAFPDLDYFHVKVVYGEDDEEWFSEPFERVACEDPTLMIAADFNDGKDCFGNYHGALPTYAQATNNYISQTRIYGTVEKIGISTIKELSDDVEISTTVEQLYLLRTSRKVPEYVANKIAECFSGATFGIDGVVYEGGSRIDKDFEEGRMWIVSSEIKQRCTTDNFKCS